MNQKPKPANLAGHAYDMLRKDILRGYYVPSQRLVERALTETLGVSRTPLRQALHRLEAEAFVERAPERGGYIVRRLDRSEITDLFRVRIELESLAIRWAVSVVTDEELRELEEIEEKMIDCWRRNQVDKVTLANSRFHRRICQLSGNNVLVEMIDTLKNRIHRAIAKGLDVQGAFDETVREHAAVVEAMRGRDAEAAEEALRRHILRSARTVLSIL